MNQMPGMLAGLAVHLELSAKPLLLLTGLSAFRERDRLNSRIGDLSTVYREKVQLVIRVHRFRCASSPHFSTRLIAQTAKAYAPWLEVQQIDAHSSVLPSLTQPPAPLSPVPPTVQNTES